MGLIEFLVIAVVVVVLVYIATLAIDKMAPGHPSYINNLLWFVCVLVILLMLVKAMGLLGYDPQIPRIR